MTILLLTLAITFIIIVIAIAFLAIGWLITGKSKLRPGACGRDPTKKRDDAECSTGNDVSCYLCKPKNNGEKK